MPATAVAADLITAFDADDEAGLDPIDRRGQRGQGMVEYAFILVLVAMVVLVSVVVLGKQTSNLYSNISSGLGA
jgi:Flp pilus assembly pilin Flp